MINKTEILQNIIKFCGEDEESALELLQLIQKTIEESCVQLVALNFEKDTRELASIAHKLRFTFSVIGANNLLNLATSIEESIEENRTDDHTVKEFEQLKVEFVDLNSMLNSKD